MKKSMQQVLQMAVEHAKEGITIGDASQLGFPLIYVNNGFLQMTGYTADEVIGKSCRFLQGEQTDPNIIADIRKAIQEQRSIMVELVNYNKKGQPFWNKLSLYPIFEGNQQLAYYIGVQYDISLQKEKETIEEKVKQQKLITQISLLAQEKERDEIGKELHDNVNQLLATCKLYLNIAYTDKLLRQSLIKKTEVMINNIIEEIRQISKALVGPRFDEISLKESVDDLVQSLQIVVPFEINYCCDHLDEDLLSQSKKLILFRVVQEQLNNIIKYAQANSVIIRFKQYNNQVCLQIKDDGIGFNANDNFKGIGLKNISSRVSLENGTVQVNSSEGNGCEMNIVLPLTNGTT